MDEKRETHQSFDNTDKLIRIVVAATFMAEPIKDTLDYFMDKLNIQGKVIFASYNQVLQQLLDPKGLFASNSQGINIILIRFEDCYRYVSKTLELEIKKELVQKTAKEFIATMKQRAEKAATPYFICLCPSSPRAEMELEEVFIDIERNFEEEFSGFNHVSIIKQQEINRLYPVEEYYDEHTNRIAHIPYTEAYYTSLAAVLARKIYVQAAAPYKVIIVDCDNTLWKGVCGESGLTGIEISYPYGKFQDFLEQKRKEGMLICVCSKNNEEDVFEVFEKHPDMILKKESIVSWHCNWEPKSQNIRKLEQELGLAFDSMIFIDDNPLECAEVHANCPEILTLQFPKDDYEIRRFMDHVWPFEQRPVTKEDKARTLFYQQNSKREELQNNSSSYEGFLAGLNLEIKFEKAAKNNISRISQLTQRTNQFNFTTIRRSEREIEEIGLSEEAECFVISAKDRFGDYGMVGVIIFRMQPAETLIDTFCLSCRALGRNIEYKMLEYISAYSLEHGIESVKIPFIQSERNKPAFDFLNQVISNCIKTGEIHYNYVLSAREGILLSKAAKESQRSIGKQAITDKQPANGEIVSVKPGKTSEFLSYIVTNLNNVDKIAREINSQKTIQVLVDHSNVPPTTPVEIRLEEIWSEYLKINHIGINNDFFTLGGTSILLMRILSKVKKEFQVDISVKLAFEGDFTIAKLSKEIVCQKLKNIDINQLNQKMRSIEALSEKQMLHMLIQER